MLGGVACAVLVAMGQVCCGGDGREAAKAPAGRVGIDAVAFLAGDWSAPRAAPGGGTGSTQEVWSGASGNNMMGMFRWLGAEGTPLVFELLTITEEDETLVLRLRHQDAGGRAWEEPDQPATLHLERLAAGTPDGQTPTIAVFRDSTGSCDLASCEYDGSVPGRLTITVRFDDPQRPDLVFELTGPDAASGGAEPGPLGEESPGGVGAIAPGSAREVFARFASLEGEWIGRSTKGWEERIVYQTVAGGSVVVERSFEAHPGEQMYTMVHLDQDRLMLTHYCVARNQPRLVCTGWDGQAATFEFLDGTNLGSRDTGHMDKVVVRFLDDRKFSSQWTWYQDGQESWMEEIVHERAGDR